MDEGELLRRAVRRRLITEDQLREAQSFAGEGRSVAAVLIDLGHLRAEDLLKLEDAPRAAPPPPTLGRAAVFFLVVLGGVIGFAIARSTQPRGATRTVYVPNPVMPPPRPETTDRIGEKGRDLVRQAENAQAEDAKSLLERAVVLLEETIPDASRGPLDQRLALARGRELLKQWNAAHATYRCIGNHPDALRGAARCSLALKNWAEALLEGQAACREEEASAESNLLCGRAMIGLGLGRSDEARHYLLRARHLDPRLASVIDGLLVEKP